MRTGFHRSLEALHAARILTPRGGIALVLALELGHKVPDCVYLALAEREG